MVVASIGRAVLLLLTAAVACAVAQDATVSLPLQATVTASGLPSAAPALTTYWAVSATATGGLVASRRYQGGGTNLQNTSMADVAFASPNNTITAFAASRTTNAFAAIAGNIVYFFGTTKSTCVLTGSYSAPLGQSFDLSPTSTNPFLVINDTLIIGTYVATSSDADVSVVALNMSTASYWWSAAFSGIRYANFAHEYSTVLGSLLLQTSSSGSSSVTYLYSFAGVSKGVSIPNSDSPDYSGFVLNSTMVMQARFSMTFFALPSGTGEATVARKDTFSTLECVGIRDPIAPPIVRFGSTVYTVCLYTIFAVDAVTLDVVTKINEPSSKEFTMGAAFDASSTTTVKLFLGTRQGNVYRVNFGTNTLTLLYTDPDVSLWGGPDTEVGMLFLRGYYPVVSSNSLTANTATPMLSIGTRVLSSVSTLRGFNPLLSTLSWKVILPNFRLAYPQVCDGLHCVVSSAADPNGGSDPAPSIPLRVHTAYALVQSANTTIGRSTAPSPPEPYYTQTPASPTPLGVAFDIDATKTLIVSTNGLYSVTGGSAPSTTLLCAISPVISALHAAPTWIYRRWSTDVNVTFNRTVETNVTVNQTNTTTNVTVLVNTTVNTTVPSWRIDTVVTGTKTLCFVDTTYGLRCYNTTSGLCSSRVQLCDASGAGTPNPFRPLRPGDGLGIVYCTAAPASAAAQVVDVLANTVLSIGTKSTCGVVGGADTAESAVYVPEEQTGASASADPSTKRFTLRKYLYNTTSSPTAVWSASINVSIASNIYVEQVPTGANSSSSSTLQRALHAISTAVPQNKIRGYYLVSLQLANGSALNAASAGGRFPTVELDGSNERALYLSGTVPTSPSVTGQGRYGYVFAKSLVAVVNTSWPPTHPRRVDTFVLRDTTFYKAGFFSVSSVAPLVADDLKIAVVPAQGAVVGINLFNGSVVWRFPLNISSPTTPTLLHRVNNSVVFSTASGIAVTDIPSGIAYVEVSYVRPSVAVAMNATVVHSAAVAGTTNGVVDSYTSQHFSTAVYSSEGLFCDPFYVQPGIGSNAPPLAGTYTPRILRTSTITPKLTSTPTASAVVTPSHAISRTHTSTEEQSGSVSAHDTLSVNPLESKTRRQTASALVTGSRSVSSSDVVSPSGTNSLPPKVPTRSASATSTATNSGIGITHTKRITMSRDVSPTRGSGTITGTQRITWSMRLSPSHSHEITGTMRLTESHSTTITSTAPMTETLIYIPPITPAPTPVPTPAPPNLAAPPEEASYAWVAGPSLALIALVVIISLAIIAKKKRAKKKSMEAMRRHERGDEVENGSGEAAGTDAEELTYRPPKMEHEADLLEEREW